MAFAFLRSFNRTFFRFFLFIFYSTISDSNDLRQKSGPFSVSESVENVTWNRHLDAAIIKNSSSGQHHSGRFPRTTRKEHVGKRGLGQCEKKLPKFSICCSEFFEVNEKYHLDQIQNEENSQFEGVGMFTCVLTEFRLLTRQYLERDREREESETERKWGIESGCNRYM